jgi:dGTPase
MAGHPVIGHDGRELRVAHAGAHADAGPRVGARRVLDRTAREELEDAVLAPGATRSRGSGRRAAAEEPDALRTCFERDRDRILHSTAFRRLAGKTQVFVHPEDHQRTRLTHALEVAQVATAVGSAVGLNVVLLTAMSWGHDVGHTPGAHAGETALAEFVPDFHHARWGADVVLAPLNLCAETLDGVRCHSWSLPTPSTPEGQVLSWADRIAYCTHDLEDAVSAGLVLPSDLPDVVVATAGTTRSDQLNTFIGALVDGIINHGVVGMDAETAAALAALREFNYQRIYMRPESVAEGRAVVNVLRALVEYYAEDPARVASDNHPDAEPLHAAVAYVAGMTDRFAFQAAVELLGWRVDRLPRGIDSPYASSCATRDHI